NLDKQRINPIIAYQPGQVENSPECRDVFHRFDQSMDYFPRVGAQCMTALERQCFQDCERQQFQGMTSYQQQTVAVASSQEMQRMVGGARLGALIDYGGYDRTWTRVFAHADLAARRTIYLHNDMQSERTDKYWNLASNFAFY